MVPSGTALVVMQLDARANLISLSTTQITAVAPAHPPTIPTTSNLILRILYIRWPASPPPVFKTSLSSSWIRIVNGVDRI